MVSLPVHLGHTISTYVVLHITYTALLVASSHSITAKLAGPKFGHPGPWNAKLDASRLARDRAIA